MERGSIFIPGKPVVEKEESSITPNVSKADGAPQIHAVGIPKLIPRLIVRSLQWV